MIGVTRMIRLTKKTRAELEAIVARTTELAGVVRRARVVLLRATGMKTTQIAERLELSREAVSRILKRFADGGVEGLQEVPKAGRQNPVADDLVEQVVQLAMSPPPAGRSRWTTRLLGKHTGLANSSVAKILQRNELKPHLARTYKVSMDPAFAAKVTDVVGLYLDPPKGAIVLSVDEKTGIQALERTQLPLPLRTGRAARHTHDYKRHGVLDLFAALEIANGTVTHELRDSHTGADFLGFMKKVERKYRGQALHVIVDNSSTHGTPDVKTWLKAHPQVTFHYTPTSASWLNQVEGFFGILTKQSLSKTSFPTKRALRDHVAAFLREWNRHPVAFEWTKPAAAIIRSHRRMRDRISRTVH